MELEIFKDCFLEVDKISLLKNSIVKMSNCSFLNDSAKGELEVDIAFSDNDGNDCFKALNIDFDLQLDGIILDDVKLKKSNVFVVEGSGVKVDYTLLIEYSLDKDLAVEVVKMNDSVEELDNNENDFDEAQINEEINKLQEELILIENDEEVIEKIKEDLSKSYEDELKNNLNQREISINTTHSNNSELDFLSFFNSKESYYRIKTVECKNDKELNEISKKYNVSINSLIKGYDRANGKVVFKVEE